MTKKRPYNRRKPSKTQLPSHKRAMANRYKVFTIIEMTKQMNVTALDEEQAKYFAENRIRNNSKTLSRLTGGNVGDVHVVSVSWEEKDD